MKRGSLATNKNCSRSTPVGLVETEYAMLKIAKVRQTASNISHYGVEKNLEAETSAFYNEQTNIQLTAAPLLIITSCRFVKIPTVSLNRPLMYISRQHIRPHPTKQVCSTLG